MRRAWAVTLLVLFSFPLILPALLASDPDSNLPLCCRRDGKHRCAMAANAPSTGDPAFQSQPCPDFPVVRGLPGSPGAGLAHPMRIAFAIFVDRQTVCTRTDVLFHSSFDRAEQKRGPPRFAS